MMRAGALLLAGVVACLQVTAQEIEGLIMEVYHVNRDLLDRGPTVPPVPPGCTTYRIFLDLAPGHELQAVYGDEAHPLYLGTTGRFYNDPHYGKESGDDIPIRHLDKGVVPLDTWITVGAGTEDHLAVLKRNDTDGSLFAGSWKEGKRKDLKGMEGVKLPLARADGLVATDTILEVVQFGMDLLPMAFNPAEANVQVNDTLLRTTNGAWAVLGGIGGMAPENHVLIAQVTTEGRPYFAFNVQVEAPDGSTTRWVWNDPVDGERQFSGLRSEGIPEELLIGR